MKQPRVPGTHAHRSPGGGVEWVTEHCGDCDAPLCPHCDAHTEWCDGCGFFSCPNGCWSGTPLGPTFVLN